MSIDRALSRGRAAAEARMPSTCTIRRKTTATTTDPTTGFKVPVWQDVYTGLPCRVDWQDAGAGGYISPSIGGEVEVTRSRRVLKVPHHARNAKDHDVAEITGGDVDGLFFTMPKVAFADQKKQQELPVVETQRPEGWS
ncbi:MAG TPA: DUF6093 family protein [Nocardioides sp.]